jgi:hypothetical protein
MPQQGGPKTPKIEFLTAMIMRLDAIVNNGESLAVVGDSLDPENKDVVIVEILDEPTLIAWRDALEWLEVFLTNRRDYHKRQNISKKITTQLLEDALARAGVDTKKIRAEAERAADDSIL